MKTANGIEYSLSDLFNKVYVYLYRDPKNGKPIYVGKGIGFRAWEHLGGYSHNRRLDNLIRKRTHESFEILPEIIHLFGSKQNDAALELEKRLIAKYGRADRRKGPLFNNTDGGEGALGQVTEQIEFRGKVYPNRTELCREYGIEESTARRRIGLGWTLKEALGVVERKDKLKPRPVTLGDRTYKSIRAFAKTLGLDPDLVRSQLNKGFTPEEIANNEVRRLGTEIQYDGKTYHSIKAFAEAIEKSYKAVGYWLETGWSPQEIAEDMIKNRSALYVEFHGKSMTMGQFAEYCNLSPTTSIKYRNQGMPLEDIYEMGHRPLAEKLGGRKISCRGVTYSSLLQFNKKVLHINHSTVHKWVYEFGLSPEDCLEIVENARSLKEKTGKSMRACLSATSIEKRQHRTTNSN